MRLRPTLPREHGVWFVTGASLLVGPAATGMVAPSHGVLAGCVLALLVFRATSRSPRTADMGWALGTLSLATALGVWLLVGWTSPLLVATAIAGALLAFAHVWLDRERLARAVGSELCGMGLLTLVAPASLALSGRTFDAMTLGLCAANTLHFMASVPYVRARVFTTKSREVWDALRWAPVSLAVAGAAALAMLVTPLSALSFAVLLVRAGRLALERPRPVSSLTRLGLSEVASTAAYVALLAATLRV